MFTQQYIGTDNSGAVNWQVLGTEPNISYRVADGSTYGVFVVALYNGDEFQRSEQELQAMTELHRAYLSQDKAAVRAAASAAHSLFHKRFGKVKSLAAIKTYSDWAA